MADAEGVEQGLLDMARAAEAAPGPTGVSGPAEGSSRGRRRWADYPLRAKLALMLPAVVIWSVVGGYALGRLPEWSAPLVLIPVAGAMSAAAVMAAGRWIARPIERLAAEARRATMSERPLTPRDLPVARGDEVGRLAEAIRRLAVAARNDRREAVSLRRTLDHRVAHATRSATAQLSQLAMRDALTGLGNRRFLDAHLPTLMSGCRESRTDLACLAFDVDGFKPVNDTAGHAAGDALLQAIADLLKGIIREDDLAARLGGDEFVVCLPGADVLRANAVGQQARRLFDEQAAIIAPQAPPPGLSFGVATLHNDRPADAAELLRRADERLYEAKPRDRRR